jgi:hypothetical protein
VIVANGPPLWIASGQALLWPELNPHLREISKTSDQLSVNSLDLPEPNAIATPKLITVH